MQGLRAMLETHYRHTGGGLTCSCRAAASWEAPSKSLIWPRASCRRRSISASLALEASSSCRAGIVECNLSAVHSMPMPTG